MIETKTSLDKGQGIFATQTILIGTRILSENPLLQFDKSPTYVELLEAYTNLSTVDRETFLSLSCGLDAPRPKLTSLSRAHISPERSQETIDRVIATFKNNAFDIPGANGMHGSGIFFVATRMNHSCVPNVCHSWKTETQQKVSHALRDIKAGEELTIAYCRPFMSRKARQEFLQQRHGFFGACEACDGDTQFARDSERRRQEMREWDAGLRSLRLYRGQMRVEATVCARLVEVIEAEGLSDWCRGELYLDLSELHEQLGE